MPRGFQGLAVHLSRAACPTRRPTRKSRLSASARFRIIWAGTQAPAASRPRTNGFMRPIGIASSWTNITTAHGAKTRRSCLRRKTRKRWNSGRARASRNSTKTSCPSPRSAIFTSPARRSGRLPPASLSRSRSSTGRIRTSSGPSRTGKAPDNPYAALPRMVLLTYQLPDAIREIAMQGEFNEFDLNVFFSADGHWRECEVHLRGRSSEVAGPDPRGVPGDQC